MTEVTKAAKAREPLTSPRMCGAEYERHVWVVTPEAGTSIEEMLRASYWSTVAVNLRPWDRIEVRAEDGVFYAELLVLSCDRTWAKVHKLSYHELVPAEVMSGLAPPVSDEYRVEFKGPLKKHCIIRRDGSIIREGIAAKDDAYRQMAEHVKTVGA